MGFFLCFSAAGLVASADGPPSASVDSATCGSVPSTVGRGASVIVASAPEPGTSAVSEDWTGCSCPCPCSAGRPSS